MILLYPAVFEFCEEGGYTVTFPDLPGCVTEGDDLAEAMYMAQDAASGWILSELEEGRTAPQSSDPKKIKVRKNQLVNIIVLDMDAYAEKYGSHSVKKTLTIPAWQNTYVERHGISCSKVLQDAISKIAMAG
ncbi:MAG: type II toxin-antitoxin system HicB family antitoxin [Lachnospiraceae bacterium]|nr:type II toxin-antitoxin system HicB family antitoxin [Lachnospiraceae bacterium]